MANTSNKLDFDDLVKKVQDSLIDIEDETLFSKKNKISKFFKMALDGLLSMNLFGTPNKDINYLQGWSPLEDKGLSPSQIDDVNIASDLLRAFEKTKKYFEEEKKGKDPLVIQEIEGEIENAKKLYENMYKYRKNNFYCQQ